MAPSSVPAQALSKALDAGTLVMSNATMREITDVLGRPKFRPYLTANEGRDFTQLLDSISLTITIVQRVRRCRDPNEDKFLELALAAQANWIITGDQDLLVLEIFEDTRI